MEKSTRLIELEEERDRLKTELANEFTFFSATNEFREGMLPAIIALMKRYDSIEHVLRQYESEVFTPVVEPPLDIDPPPVAGDTLHFSTKAGPST